MTIFEAFVAASGKSSQATSSALWGQFAEKTADVMTEGPIGLAMLWESAWPKAGKTVTGKPRRSNVMKYAIATWTRTSYHP
ncbi:MAG: hypothetical protein EOS76_04655 [Mesorhizobium sp.]|nr:hypothetical protein [Mesorhizobium sp. M2A.F.Ca.ET.046.03.2.1]AZO34805.1 hypothetical protein EJ072_10355 [Mesorhizobium sp. M2A.F.Ca.ET.046.03.2.1]RWE21432.1 MAG: hypothetical protein EOS76_04655 [Mesorhizobium sp.]